MIRVFGIVAMTTLVVGLAALVIASLIVNANMVGEITRYNNEITDDVAFAPAGIMHNFGYLGGLIGIINGGVTIFRLRRRSNTSTSSQKTPHPTDETEDPKRE